LAFITKRVIILWKERKLIKNEDVVVGLDIGTTKVVIVVGQVQEGMVQIIGIGKAPNSGMRKGSIVDIEETVSAISNALEDAERSSGMKLESCFCSIEGNQINTISSKGVIAVSRADGEITDQDIERVTEAAKSVALPPNFEILHIVPRYFSIDGQEGVKDPLGMSAIRLEVETHVIGVTASVLKNLGKTILQSGLEIDGVVFSPLAAAKAILTKNQKELGVILIDIGSSNTNIAVFEERTLIHSSVLPIGSNHITSDIAIGMRTDIEVAEKIKINEVTAMPDQVKENEKIDLSKYKRDEKEKPSKQFVCQVTEARLKELFSMIKEKLSQIDRDEMLPAGAVLTGGGAKQTGIVEFSKNFLKLPVKVGAPVLEVSGIVDKLDDPRYATAIGLMLWGIDEYARDDNNKKSVNINRKIGGVLDKAREIFKNFIP